MRLLVLASCALLLSLPGYGQKDLKADLLTLSKATNSQVVGHLMALAEKTHEPSRPAVDVFARDLIQFLGHANLRDAEASQLANEVDAVFKSAGTSTAGYLDHIGNFRAVLLTMGVSPVKLCTELETIGKQVRGPEDAPVRPVRVMRR
jgi:hypothetical protein